MKNRQPLLNDELKHKKKSTAKGRPRSKHKHEYETVLLHQIVPNFDNSAKTHEILSATKVCTVCGRISERDQSRYEYGESTSKYGYLFNFTEKHIKNPESLEDWYAYGYVPKTAYRKPINTEYVESETKEEAKHDEQSSENS